MTLLSLSARAPRSKTYHSQISFAFIVMDILTFFFGVYLRITHTTSLFKYRYKQSEKLVQKDPAEAMRLTERRILI